MRRIRLALLPAAAVLISACSTGTESVATQPSPASPTSGASASAEATRIEVKLSDSLRIEPATNSVPAGVPVTFVVTNTGALDHEFFLGDEAAQAEHEQEMQGMGGMAHDEAMGIGLEPGETKELTVTLPETGTINAGCHVSGHYAGGMKATIEVGS